MLKSRLFIRNLIIGILMNMLFQNSINAIDIYGHRGASSIAPENTLQSLEMAFEIGCRGVEFDLQLTKDGTIIVLHDDTLLRTAIFHPGNSHMSFEEFDYLTKTHVKDLTYDEIKKINIGSWKGADYFDRNVIVPTFRDVLKSKCDGQVYLVEIKSGDDRIISPLIDLIKEKKPNPSEIIFISFDYDVIKNIKENLPDYRVMYIIKYEKEIKDAIDKVINSNLDGLSLKAADFVTDDIVKLLHDNNKLVHVWVSGISGLEDSIEMLLKMKKRNVDVFISNLPQDIKETVFK
jgi:glycerophosphoryl diester phosphodiesterase